MDTGESREPGRGDAEEPTGAPSEPVVGGPHDVRVGDADRNAALSALDRHLEDGRITIDEYGDRSAAASVAVTRSDVVRLFADLPAPHPPLPSPPRAGEIGAGEIGAVAVPTRRERHPAPVPMIALGIGMLALVSLAAALTLAGIHAGGLVFLPFLFVMIGGLRHRGRGPHL